MREEYYDEGGHLIRTMTLGGFKKMDDRVIPTELTIQKAGATDEKTTVTYERISFDRNLSDDLFNQANLKNVSRKGLDLSQGWLTRTMQKSQEGA